MAIGNTTPAARVLTGPIFDAPKVVTPRASSRGWEEALLEAHGGRLVDAAAIKRRPGDHVLCLSFWDITSLIDLEPEGTSVGGLPGAVEGPFHASGHIDGPGMEQVIETIKPERLLPVHTQRRGWFEERWPGKVMRAGLGV